MDVGGFLLCLVSIYVIDNRIKAAIAGCIMYIRTKSSPNSPRKSIQIVEGQRDPVSGKVKQVIVRHLGVAHTDAEEGKMRAFATQVMEEIALEREKGSRQGSLFALDAFPRRGRPKKKRLDEVLGVEEVKLCDLTETQRRVEGVHEVGGAVHAQLGFDSLLAHKRDQGILRDIVLGRMFSPDSKRGLCRILSEQFGRGHDLEAVYRMMDKLHPEIGRMKELCFKGSCSLVPDKEVQVVFFDVTTLYFESTQVDTVRNFGYSKDHRFTTVQVVLALASNADGLPLGYELFSGNTAEVKTLLAALENWKRYLPVKEVCFIADRAMFSKANLAALEEAGCTYIIAAKLRTLPQSHKEQVLSQYGYKATVLGNHLAWVKETPYEGKRLITSYKSARAKQDAAGRQEVIGKIKKTIGKKGSTKKFITNQGVKRFTSVQDSTITLDQTKIDQDALWDGLHGVITNDPHITPAQAIAKYARLWVIEESFRINKHNLKMRPIYHWTPKRIETHIALCYMSYAILRHIQYKVNLIYKISPDEIIRSLMDVQASILQHRITRDSYRMPGRFNDTARKIYKVFNIRRSSDPHPVLN